MGALSSGSPVRRGDDNLEPPLIDIIVPPGVK